MAIFHVATNTPSKSDLIAPWLHEQPWGPNRAGPIELLGGFHLDDPDGEVGMQVFVVAAGGRRFQVPLTYRATPLPALGDAMLGEMQHSVLGARFVYDGLADERFVTVLAGVALHGYGQALGFAAHGGRWYSVPDEIILHGHDVVRRRVAVDRFAASAEPSQVSDTVTGGEAVMRNDEVELTVFRLVEERPAPAIGVSATWPGQATPVPLVAARLLVPPASSSTS